MQITYNWFYKELATQNQINTILNEIKALIKIMEIELKLIGEKCDSIFDDKTLSDNDDNFENNTIDLNDFVSYKSEGILNENHIYFNYVHKNMMSVTNKYLINDTFHFIWNFEHTFNSIQTEYPTKYQTEHQTECQTNFNTIVLLILLSVANNINSFRFFLIPESTNITITTEYEKIKNIYEIHIKPINLNFNPLDNELFNYELNKYNSKYNLIKINNKKIDENKLNIKIIAIEDI